MRIVEQEKAARARAEKRATHAMREFHDASLQVRDPDTIIKN